MEYLLDTHIILWWLADPKKLSAKIRSIITDRANRLSVSSVSFWEMAIKSSIGRITIPRNMLRILADESIEVLPLDAEEALSVVDLPEIHKDPFDRMLVAQAKYNDLILVTQDKMIKKYPIVTY